MCDGRLPRAKAALFLQGPGEITSPEAWNRMKNHMESIVLLQRNHPLFWPFFFSQYHSG
jgi:hypothetical protein